jgi:hypothetical protein
MRLWSLHPRQLDAKGLVALWREGLLALAVVRGKTRGYRRHPQLVRFLACRNPPRVLESYLRVVLAEAQVRGYAFDRSKLGKPRGQTRLVVARGQLDYEWSHLLRKLHGRDRARWVRQRNAEPEPHPLFRVRPGPIARWERARQS